MSGQPPKAGVNVDEVVALGAAIQAAMEVGQTSESATPKFTLAGTRRVTDVMSHSLGAIAVSPDGTSYVNDVIIRRNLAIPAENKTSYLHETHGGANTKLEVYLTQGESTRPLDCTILGKYVFSGISPTDREVRIDVGLSYDVNGLVQVRAVQRDTGQRLAMRVEPVPDDLSWLGLPPRAESQAAQADPVQIFLLIDGSASMAGSPLLEAQNAAKAFLDKCDFTSAEVGLISFSDEVVLQCELTSNSRKLQAALVRLEADGTTNLSDALEMARDRLLPTNRRRYIVILTDGYPDSTQAAVDEAGHARDEGIEIVAIGTGAADLDYLRRLASTETGSIFARQGELVGAFGHIARMIAEGGRGLRQL
jgi:Mg-chelatase subunit ChlD